MNDHNIPIKAYLTAEEYLAAVKRSEDLGQSQSSYIRMLIKRDLATAAMDELHRSTSCQDRNK